MAERPYSGWPMKSGVGSYVGTDTRVGRTGPERASDIVNVKDWGAVGDTSSPDGPKIQNAINFCIYRGGGIVYFPPGQYSCASGLVVGTDDIAQRNNFVQLVGCGPVASSILVAGVVWGVSKGTKTYDLIGRVEGVKINSYGCIKVTGEIVSIRSCRFAGVISVDASQANGCTVSDCGGDGGDGLDATAGGPKIHSTLGIGIFLGNNCLATNCRLTGGNFITYALSGNGAACIGCSTERTEIAARIGWGPDPAATSTLGAPGMKVRAYAATVQGMETERQATSIEVYDAIGCLVTGNTFTGGHGPTNDQLITGMSWSGGTATVSTSPNNHNLPVGPTVILLNINGGDPGGSPWRPTFYTVATRSSATGFTYPLAVNPGTAPTPGPLLGWSYPADFCIRVREAAECVIVSNNVALEGYQGSVDLDYGGAAVHANNMFMGTPGGRGWIAPEGPNAAGWKFIQCGVDGLRAGSNPLSNPKLVISPGNNLTFANLPGNFTQIFDPVTGAPRYQTGPFEGMEYDIKDGQKATVGGAAVWGDAVTGGGTGKYRVRYDVSGIWRRIG